MLSASPPYVNRWRKGKTKRETKNLNPQGLEKVKIWKSYPITEGVLSHQNSLWMERPGIVILSTR